MKNFDPVLGLGLILAQPLKNFDPTLNLNPNAALLIIRGSTSDGSRESEASQRWAERSCSLNSLRGSHRVVMGSIYGTTIRIHRGIVGVQTIAPMILPELYAMEHLHHLLSGLSRDSIENYSAFYIGRLGFEFTSRVVRASARDTYLRMLNEGRVWLDTPS